MARLNPAAVAPPSCSRAVRHIEHWADAEAAGSRVIAASRATVFTTHTPVAAGFDRFPPALIARYLGRYATDQLGKMKGAQALDQRRAGSK